MKQNIDVAATLSDTIKSAELLEFGPQRGRIADVDYHTYPPRDGQPERRVLRLELDDGRFFDLNVTNKRFLIDAFGRHSRGWIGKLIEMWHDASIMFGTEPKGGHRPGHTLVGELRTRSSWCQGACRQTCHGWSLRAGKSEERIGDDTRHDSTADDR